MKQYSIEVQHCGTFNCLENETLLAAGQRAGFGFPNACRNGNCERCLGKLVSGSIQHSRQGHITYADTSAAEAILTCVALALEDCIVNVPNTTAPGQLPIVTKACQVLSLEPLAHNISLISLQLPAGRAIQWHPGQYLLLLINDEEYAFSIANAPNGRHLELHIRHDSANASAHKIIEHLQNNPVVQAKLPFGNRHLGSLDEQAPLWLICGSTGFSQAKAIIEGVLNSAKKRSIHLFWGARTQEDLYLHALAQQWADQGLIEYTPILSEQSVKGFQQGLVHQAVLAEKRPNVPPVCLIAGSPDMGWAVFDALVAAGFDADKLHSDVFDYAPRS